MVKRLYKVTIGNGVIQVVYYSISADISNVITWAIEKYNKEHRFSGISYINCVNECQEQNIGKQ